MNRKPISIDQFGASFYETWNSGWFLLTSGDYDRQAYNSMTVSWGSFGCLWNLPTATVVVRPTRYTFEFINQYDSYTLCAFPERYRKILGYLGSHSGRDIDKIHSSGLTPCASRKVAAPGYEEAELVVECRRLYWQDLLPEHFMDERIQTHYPQKDYHRMLVGEIVAVSGDADRYAI